MRNASVWQRVLGLVRAVVEAVVFDEEADAIVVSVRPRNVKMTAPVSVAAWGIGFGWLIADTMA